jgi:hypothetical protein
MWHLFRGKYTSSILKDRSFMALSFTYSHSTLCSSTIPLESNLAAAGIKTISLAPTESGTVRLYAEKFRALPKFLY